MFSRLAFRLAVAALVCAVVLALAPRASAQAVIRPGDLFEMRFSGMPADVAAELAMVYTVGDDGSVEVPLIGTVRAAGLSTTQFAKSVEAKFVAAKIFTQPTVIVNLQQQSRFVTVGGEVRAPQVVPWSQDLNLSQAIKRAGGPGEFGNIKKIRVLREGKLMGVFNLRAADKDPNQNPKLLPGDEIEVP